ncbi:MAG: AAA family ATPase, partial [Methylobacter sp.]
MPSPLPDNDIKILLLGGFSTELNGSPVARFSYNKMRALLAYLAVEQGKDHNREFLSELLWSDFDIETARHNLRRALSSLRGALESPTGRVIFLTTKHTIRLTPSVYVDALEFAGRTSTSQDNNRLSIHQQKILIDLYKGEFLSGLYLPNCPDFEDWLQAQRETLHRRALSLLESLSNHYIKMGDYSQALQFALRYTALEPWDEEAHRRIMHLYALNNQNSSALQQYEICCRLLKKELSLLPSEETRLLAQRISNSTLQHWATDARLDPTLPQTAPVPPLFVERRNNDRRKTKPHETALDERRQVSVLYCELIVPAIDDPDEAMAQLSAPQSRCVEIIRQFSGHIVQTHGGGILAYFGYPQAHEHAARYAVQTAMKISREASDLIEIRASVHTGLIITGCNPSMPDTVGKTSKIAIKLNHYLAHSGVAISQQTQSLVSGFFECISLGFQLLSDHAGHLEIFKVLQKNSAYARLDTTAQLTPLVGRKAEIAELMALWEKTEHGSGHIVLVRGEAGIGKSRLLYSIKKRLADKTHIIRELHCFPEFSQSPFHPLIAMLEAVIGFTHHDSPEVKFGKVAAHAETHYPELMQDAVPMLTQLLSLSLCEHYQPSNFSPQKQKALTIAILLNLLKALSLQQPVLFIVEDLHWVDPSTLELLTLLVEQEERGAVLVVLTARPELIPPWNETLTSTITLEPLSESETAEIITSFNKNISEETVRRIVERTDGIPLFAEEITKIAIQYDQAYIPSSLHDLLTMRLDNMGEAKYTAQLAATIGRKFDINLLRTISPHDLALSSRTLNLLQDAGLILRINEVTYQFKHALIQEAAYQSQTKADRQTTHQRIAQALQNDFPDVAAIQPELLAQHLFSSGETYPAIEYWIKAGQRAARNSANLEAIEHFNSALHLLMTLPTEQARDKTEFNILASLCLVLYAVKGYGSEEAKQINARISVLSETVVDNPELFQAKWFLVMNTIANAGSRDVSGAAMQLLNMAHDDPLRKQAAHYIVAKSAFWRGQFELTHSYAEQGIALYHPNQLPMLLEQ